MTTNHRIYSTPFAKIYPLYVAKAERKGRSKAEVDRIITWLTGFSQDEMDRHLAAQSDFKTFFDAAPKLNPARSRITGLICGVRVEEVSDPLMREVRYLDKLIDELARGRKLEKILRSEDPQATG